MPEWGKYERKRERKMARKIDGQCYDEGEPIWDLGTLECVKVEENNLRHYHGRNCDDDYIRTHAPHYAGAGSDILCLDTGKVWVFHQKTDEWVKLS